MTAGCSCAPSSCSKPKAKTEEEAAEAQAREKAKPEEDDNGQKHNGYNKTTIQRIRHTKQHIIQIHPPEKRIRELQLEPARPGAGQRSCPQGSLE